MDFLRKQRLLSGLMVAYVVAMMTAIFRAPFIVRQWHAEFSGVSFGWLFAFACLPVLMLVLIVIRRRWNTARLERRLAAAAQRTAFFRPGHFRTAPYDGSEQDRKDFHRADGAHELALKHVREAAAKGEPFFFLHSPSGCGKTSLLQAHVMPALEQDGWHVVALRGFNGVLPTLAEKLGLPTNADHASITAALASRAAATSLLVLIDPFEEFLALHPPDSVAWQSVRDWFSLLRTTPVKGLLVLLSLRGEYQASALNLGLPEFDGTRSLSIPLFSAKDAREFLRTGLEDARRLTGELPLDKLIGHMEERDDLCGLVRPVQTAFVGRAYSTFAGDFYRRILAGRQVDFVADWLQRLLERPELRLHARPVLGALLQKDGSHLPAGVAQIARECGLAPEVVRCCLVAFHREGLVRCFGPVDESDSSKLWEISHEFLAVQLKGMLWRWREVWYETVGRIFAPVILTLWLLVGAVFSITGVDQGRIAQLTDLGFHWDKQHHAVSIAVPRSSMDAATLAHAVPAIQALKCQLLDLSGCDKLTNVDALHGLTGLTSLNLSWCGNLQNVDGLKGFSALATLDLSWCRHLVNIGGVRDLSALTSLSLSGCHNLQNFDSLQGLVSLTSLDLSACHNLPNIDSLQRMGALVSLDLSACAKLPNIVGLQGLRSLTSLNLSGCDKLPNVYGLQRLSALTTLNLSGCDNLNNLEYLHGLVGLTSLNLHGCNNLENIEGLQGLVALSYLDLSACRKLPNVVGLRGLRSLTTLDLSECELIPNVGPLQSLGWLTRLSLLGCDRLPNVDGLKGLGALTSLCLSQCRHLENIGALEGLGALVSLDLSNCERLPDLAGIEGLRVLRRLNLAGCVRLQDLGGLRGLKLLNEVNTYDLTNELVQSIKLIAPQARLDSQLLWSSEP